MTVRIEVTGLDKVMKGFEKALKKVDGGSRTGMAKALLICRRDAQIMTPVDTGNLVNSCFTVVAGGIKTHTADVTFGRSPNFKALRAKVKGEKRKRAYGGHGLGITLKADHDINVEEAKKQGRRGMIVGTIGYTAYYALEVHERTKRKNRKKVTFRKPKAQAKFLEESFKRNSRRMYNAIVQGAKFR